MAYIRALRYFEPRQWLILTNCLILICSLFIAGVSAYVINEIYKETFERSTDQEDTMLYFWIAMAVLGCLHGLCAVVGITGALKVSLDMIVTYFWLAVLLLAPTLLFSVLMFEFQKLFRSWIKHRWDTPEMSSVRRSFCKPRSVSDTKCAVYPPSLPFKYNITDYTVDEWCEDFWNATDCRLIYIEATDQVTVFAEQALTATATASAVEILLLFFSLYLAYRIVTMSIITKSMNELINYFMILPAIAILLVGLDLKGDLSPTGDNDGSDFAEIDPAIDSIGTLFVSAGVIILGFTLVGIFAGRAKRRRYLYLYLVGMTVVFALLLTCGIWAYQISFTLHLSFTDSQFKTQQFACDAHLYNCCCCGEDVVDVCPEWTKEEVIDVVEVYLKLAGLCGFVSLVFVSGGVMSAYLLAKNLKEYKCEYI
uniref:Tetraspanin n=1 Tax=Rhizochromulina marina TaxID=1034831 RepID=A0A7S2R9T0_9STRA|mmetsp:Transcript_13175/g.38256  ORF Transcript_13175/g.38256 Transcript_13175/m.38256 type:complete len:424 (+) Transcript_13175:67-1338(+)